MNMMLAVEVESVPTTHDSDHHRALLYVLCDRKRKPAPGIIITGVSGDLTSSERWPFMINNDGRGDLGAAYEDASDRYFETNLRSKTMKPQELFTVTSADPEQPNRQVETTYRIRKTTHIAGPTL